MTQATPPVTPSDSFQVRPHRGALVLVLGILGIVVCFIMGIVAWIMGNNDLSAMRAGTMDPSGEGMTQAGRICGIVSVALAVLGFCIAAVWMFVIFVVIGASAAGAAGP